jgi:hypothetical protein
VYLRRFFAVVILTSCRQQGGSGTSGVSALITDGQMVVNSI